MSLPIFFWTVSKGGTVEHSSQTQEIITLPDEACAARAIDLFRRWAVLSAEAAGSEQKCTPRPSATETGELQFAGSPACARPHLNLIRSLCARVCAAIMPITYTITIDITDGITHSLAR